MTDEGDDKFAIPEFMTQGVRALVRDEFQHVDASIAAAIDDSLLHPEDAARKACAKEKVYEWLQSQEELAQGDAAKNSKLFVVAAFAFNVHCDFDTLDATVDAATEIVAFAQAHAVDQPAMCSVLLAMVQYDMSHSSEPDAIQEQVCSTANRILLEISKRNQSTNPRIAYEAICAATHDNEPHIKQVDLRKRYGETCSHLAAHAITLANAWKDEHPAAALDVIYTLMSHGQFYEGAPLHCYSPEKWHELVKQMQGIASSIEPSPAWKIGEGFTQDDQSFYHAFPRDLKGYHIKKKYLLQNEQYNSVFEAEAKQPTNTVESVQKQEKGKQPRSK